MLAFPPPRTKMRACYCFSVRPAGVAVTLKKSKPGEVDMNDHSAFTFKPRRELGKTGFTAAMLGLGDLADRSVSLEQCVATLRRAMVAGSGPG